MKKGYLTPPVIIILGLICFFVGAALFANTKLFPKSKTQTTPSQTPPPGVSRSPIDSMETSNWKTYKSNSIGFTYKYPSNMSLIDDKCAGPDRSDCLSMQTFSKSLDQSYADLIVQVKSGQSKLYEPGEEFPFLKSGIVTGIPIKIYSTSKPVSQSNTSGPTFEIYTQFLNTDKSKYYDISLSWKAPPEISSKPSSEEVAIYLNEFDQILSTFKFVE